MCIVNNEISFIRETGTGDPYTIISNSQILGAIFSNEDTFKCNMNKTMFRMDTAKQILLGKAKELDAAALTHACRRYYSDFSTALSKFKYDDLDSINPASLKAINQNLRLNSCGSMY